MKSPSCTINSTTSRPTTKQFSLLEDVAAKSLSRYNIEPFRMSILQGIFTDKEELGRAWISLGTYIMKCMRSGKSVSIPKFGTFAFTAPQFNLNGTTNSSERFVEKRHPVFAISKEFAPGKQIKSGIYVRSSKGSSLLEYSNFAVNGQIPVEKMNTSLVAVQAGLGKDSVSMAIQRIVKHISETIYAKGHCALDIPNVGRLYIRKGIAAIRFNSQITEASKRIQSASKAPLKKGSKQLDLTAENLRRLQELGHLQRKQLQFLEIDGETKQYIQQTFGKVEDLKKNQTNINFGMKGIKEYQKKEEQAKQHQRKQHQKELKKQQQKRIADHQLQQEFLHALKKILQQENITKNYVQGLFKKADLQNTSFVNQITMKDIIEKLGIRTTLEEFSQIAQMLNTDGRLHLKYSDLLEKMFPNEKVAEKQLWYERTVKQIREWFVRQKLLIKDAFKLIDKDGDGYLGDKDLSMFLLNRMKYPSSQLTTIRMEDIIRRNDVFKQGKIDLLNFGRIINAGSRFGRDWLVNAKNSVSAALARNFSSLQQAFRFISKNESKLTLMNLKKWLKENVMDDEQLIIDILVDIDKEGKGFLLEGDFKNNFSYRIWHTPLAMTVIELLQQKYPTTKQAYQFMCNHKELDYWQLVWSIQQLLGKQNDLTKKDYEILWQFLAGKDKYINYDRFERTIGRGIRGEWLYQPPHKHPYYAIQLKQQDVLVNTISQNRKCLIQRLEPYSRRGLVELDVAERVLKELMDTIGLRFENQAYRQVVDIAGALIGNRVDIKKLFAGVKIRATNDVQHSKQNIKCY